MKIAIIGQGHVGSAFKALVERRHDIVTYDPKDDADYPKAAIDSADLAVICVPTPMLPNGECDISFVETAVSKIDSKAILIESTIPPGTTDYLSKKYKKNICFSPEYIGESSYINPVYTSMDKIPFFIIGGDQRSRTHIIDIIEPIMGPHCQYFQCSAKEAELIKYMENSFLAMKVSFVNEFYDIARAFDIDWHIVREGWLLDERVGRPFTSVFKNNRGYSGKCLPKDVNAITRASIEKGHTPTLLQSMIEFNEKIQGK